MDASCQRPDDGSSEICLVCGEPLGSPVVVCSRCDTPHHRECWDYNEGCAVYGCKAGEALERAATGPPVPAVVPDVEGDVSLFDALALRLFLEYRELTTRGAGLSVPVLVFVVYASLLGIVAQFTSTPSQLMSAWFGTSAAIVALIVTAYVRVERLHGFDRGRYMPAESVPALPGGDDGDKDLLGRLKDLENPGIVAIYGLFQERWRIDEVLPATAVAVARALEQHGCPPFALHVLHKCQDEAAILERARVLAGDPAFLWDAFDMLVGRGDVWSDEHRASAVDLTERLAAVLGDPEVGLPADATSVLVVAPQRRSLGGAGGARVLTRDEGRRRLDDGAVEGRFRWLVPASALGTPHRPRAVVEVRLTNGGCSLHTREGHYDLDWDEVTAVLPWWMGPPPSRERPAEPCLDVFCNVRPFRLRLHEATSELFTYLGRRKSLSHQRNFRLVVVDFMRYARSARFGHGALATLGCEARDRSIFADAEAFEGYVRWFQATGAVAAGLGSGGQAGTTR